MKTPLFSHSSPGAAVSIWVEVRKVIDGYGGGYIRSSAYRMLHHARVPAARFLHSALPWRMLRDWT